MQLDALDRRLLDRIQEDFPLAERPFLALAEELGTSEDDVLARVARLQEAGAIREISPVFNMRRVGGKSLLCAARVAPEHIEAVAAFLDGFVEVTHSYEREHRYNLWFTLVGTEAVRFDAILDEVQAQPGVEEVLSLPSTRMFKIRVRFDANVEEASSVFPGQSQGTDDAR